MSFKEELILEIKAELSDINRVLSELKQKLSKAFDVDAKEIKEELKSISREAKEVSSKLRFEEAEKDLKEIKQEVKEISTQAKSITNPFRKWLFDILAISEILENFETLFLYLQAINPFKYGFEELKKAEKGISRIAGILLSLPEAKIDLNTDEALKEAKEINNRLKALALQGRTAYEELRTVFETIAYAGYQAGLSTQEIIQLTYSLSEASKTLGWDIKKVANEFSNILEGNVSVNSELAKTLGLSKETVNEWQKAGTLFENLSQSLSPFVEIAQKSGNTFSGILEKAKNLGKALAEIASKPLFNQIKSDLNALIQYLTGAKQKAGELSQALSGAIPEDLKQKLQAFGRVVTEIYNQLKNFALGAKSAFSDISKVLSPFIKGVAEIYNRFKPLFDLLFKIAGYVATIAVIAIPFMKLIGVLRLLLPLFVRLRTYIAVVWKALSSPKGVIEFLKNIRAGVKQALSWFMRLGALAKSILLAVFIKLGFLIGEALSWIAQKVKAIFETLFGWIIEAYKKVKRFFTGEGKAEEAQKSPELQSPTNPEKKQVRVELDTSEAEQKLTEFKNLLKELDLESEIKTDINLSEAKTKLKELKEVMEDIPLDVEADIQDLFPGKGTEIEKSLKVKLEPDTSEIEEALQELEGRQVTVRLKPSLDHTPGWETEQ